MKQDATIPLNETAAVAQKLNTYGLTCKNEEHGRMAAWHAGVRQSGSEGKWRE